MQSLVDKDNFPATGSIDVFPVGPVNSPAFHFENLAIALFCLRTVKMEMETYPLCLVGGCPFHQNGLSYGPHATPLGFRAPQRTLGKPPKRYSNQQEGPTPQDRFDDGE